MDRSLGECGLNRTARRRCRRDVSRLGAGLPGTDRICRISDFSARIKSGAHIAARVNAANLGAFMVALPPALGLFDTIIPTGPQGWLGVVYLAVITGVVSTALMMAGAALAGSVRAAIAGGAELVTALLVGMLIFAEPLTWNYALCAAMLAGALGLTLSGRRRS